MSHALFWDDIWFGSIGRWSFLRLSWSDVKQDGTEEGTAFQWFMCNGILMVTWCIG